MEVYQSELGKITTHIGHGMVRLPEGKMSSRTGKIIRGEWVIEEAKNRVQKILKTSKVVTSKDRESVAEVVAIGAVKYAFLKQGIGADIAFDFDTSLSFEGNSGPYLQYTYARCQSVMAKSKQNVASLITKNFKLKINAEELAILRWLYRYPKVVREAGVQYAPHVVCTYLFELAQRFNSFYNTHSILGSLDYPLTRSIADFRLLLTTATAQVLKNGLSLLGIKAPDKM
jgi:arginyl-tRNA synthetase